MQFKGKEIDKKQDECKPNYNSPFIFGVCLIFYTLNKTFIFNFERF